MRQNGSSLMFYVGKHIFHFLQTLYPCFSFITGFGANIVNITAKLWKYTFLHQEKKDNNTKKWLEDIDDAQSLLEQLVIVPTHIKLKLLQTINPLSLFILCTSGSRGHH